MLQMLRETNRLYLREFYLEDLAAVFAYRSLPIVKKFDTFGTNSEEEVQNLLLKALAWKEELPRTIYFGATCLKNSHELIGEFMLRIEPQEATAEVGFMFAPAHWGKGYATETLHALSDFAQELGVKQLLGSCDPRNLASIRVMEHGGMSRKGNSGTSLHFSKDLTHTASCIKFSNHSPVK
jgi:ribosomal-protein-alanine N-acetyltransferase